ncbi:sugar efflux transporter [Paraburkholderia sp. MMS20-SJTR3]|uniref:Sugar efflux transporter n=1 Tax=Paraburkholderia sejongensis TaxID=2886946 RepID=A0ABS8JZ29_9BURK|nr:sugar efflux transporter [Paraburkholderia sp. MMS20-SJTR3]MCC8395166.1 sugar efflux transporter [Paraburkholderia sp. MMS20-SJTR3]
MLKTARFFDLLKIPGFKPLAAATLMLGVAMSFTAPYLSLFGVERAGMTPFRLGVFMTLIAASGVLASTIAGRWSDRSGQHRPLLLAALIAAALGYISLCVVRDYRLLLVVGIVFIGAGGSAISMVFSFSRAALPAPNPAERVFASATLRTILSAAWVFGPSVGALVLAATSFYGLFLFAAASFAVCGFIVWRMREPQGHLGDHTVEDTAAEPSASITVPPLTQPGEDAHETLPVASANDIMRAVAALTLLGLAANATMIVLPLYIVHGLNGTHLDVSVMLGLGALTEIPMMLALGAKSSSLHKPNWLAACAAVHAVYFVAMSLAGNVGMLIPMQMLNAFVVAVTSCLGMTYVQDLMPHSPGRATALFFNAARVGSILSGVLSGLLVQAFSYRGTFLICGFLALCALVLFAVPGYRYPLMWRAVRRFAAAQYGKLRARSGAGVSGRSE